MKAKNILKKLDYLPRWAWYLLSLFVAGPFGPLAVYLVFHVLGKMERDQEEAEYQAARARHDGHTYRDEECVVTDEETAERERREYAARRAQQERSRSQKAQDDAQTVIDDNATLEDVLQACRDALRKIRRANDIIADEALSAQIDSIENSCAQILSILEQRPQLLSQLRSFLRYYLPTTLRLLDARAKLENNASTRKAREVRLRISEALGAIDKAFLKQVEALDAYRFIDLESEMDVLRDMLKADGLIDETEGDDPFASVLGSH